MTGRDRDSGGSSRTQEKFDGGVEDLYGKLNTRGKAGSDPGRWQALRALVFHAPNRISLDEVPEPVLIEPTDAIVKVETASICGSDLHFLHGFLPLEPGTIIGHEFAGEVVETGSCLQRVKTGDRVVGTGAVVCGQCEYCREGLTLGCRHYMVYGSGPATGNLPGAQAEYVRVPFADSTLLEIPENAAEDFLFSGDVFTTGFEAVQGINPGDAVVVFGAGPIGLSAVAAAKLLGPSLLACVDRLGYRLEVARQLGADVTVEKEDDIPVAEELMELTGGRGFNFVVEAVGAPEVYYECLKVVGPHGMLSIAGIFHETLKFPVQRLVLKNITIRTGLTTFANIHKAARLLHTRKVNLLPLITHVFPFAEILKAYDLFENRREKVIKVMLKFDRVREY